MANISETLKEKVLEPSVLSALESDLTGLAGKVTGIPESDIQKIVSLAGQIALPDQQTLFGDGVGSLSSLVNELRSPEELWSSLTNPLSELGQSLKANLQSPMSGSFDKLRELSNIIPNEPGSLLRNLSDPLQQVNKVLLESAGLQRVNDYITKINDIRSKLEATPTQLATLFHDQIQSAIEEATIVVSPVLQHLDHFLSSLETDMKMSILNSQYNEILQRLIPIDGQNIADIIPTLDLGSVDAVVQIDSQLRTARVQLEDFSQEITANIGQAMSIISSFDMESWTKRMISSATIAASGKVEDLTGILGKWNDSLTQVHETIESLSLDNVSQTLQDKIKELQPLLDGFNLDDIKTTLSEGMQVLAALTQSIQEVKIDLLAGLQSLANGITQVVNSINFDIVVNNINNSLASLDSGIGEIEGLLDNISDILQNSLNTIQTELNALHSALTDPEGNFRKPFEDFLKLLRDTIPDNIPEKLEEVGQTMADAMSGLDEITFDPVFDEVIEQLDDMRGELHEIDVESLNAILREALAIALALFKEFDFKEEIDDFLIDEFDDAIITITEDPIEYLQNEVDNILKFVRDYDPAIMFDSLGITQAYDEMVEQLDSFRPSEALSEILNQIRQAAEKLESFTPTAILQPVLEPINILKQHINNLSLDPVLAKLHQTLDEFTGLINELDIESFINQLDVSIKRVKKQINELLSADGLLDFLQPIHQTIMDNINTIDPNVILQPLNQIRQTLLTAIDSVDTDALKDVFIEIENTVNEYKLPELRTNFQTKVQALTTGITTLDLPTKFSEFNLAQQGIKNALDARGVQVDPQAEDRRQMLLANIEALNPLPILAEAIEQFRAFENELTSFATELDTLLSDDGELDQPLETLATQLGELSMGISEGAPDIKQALRDAINQSYQSLGLDKVEKIFSETKSTLESFSPDNLETTINDLIMPVKAFLDNLLDPTVVFQELVTTFTSMKAEIDPGLSDFLTEVSNEIQPIMDTISDKINVLDPSVVLAQLDETYSNIVTLKDRMLNKLQLILDSVDAPYEQVIQLLDELNPGVVLAEPLSETYQAILNKIEGIDIKKVLQPVIDAIKKLRDELVAGIKRTSEAFDTLLAAAPV